MSRGQARVTFEQVARRDGYGVLKPAYKVVKITNTTTPAVFEELSKAEVDGLIDLGIEVTIGPARE